MTHPDASHGDPEESAEPAEPRSGYEQGTPEEHVRRRRPRLIPRAESEAGLSSRLAGQWAQMREVRKHEPAPIVTGPSRVDRAQVPWGIDLAAAWAWRLLLIAAAGAVLLWVVGFLEVITLPLVIALLITALVSPAVDLLQRIKVPRGLGALVVVLATLGGVGALLTFAGQQVAVGAADLADSTVAGLGQIRTWLTDGPLNASDSQINDYIQQAQNTIQDQTREGGLIAQIGEVGTALTNVVAGFFIVIFATYFFLADGNRIWAWLVRLAPRAGREQVDGSGRVAWISLTQFVRATVIVALVDAVGIMIVAAVLGVPFVLAIGVLVFLGAFVPLVGATVAGAVAVLVALVDQGPLTALLMLAGVVVVQQVEAHVLQPFLMGRWVSIHPLGVILAIGAGILIAGVPGALVAVPLVAAANAVGLFLASESDPEDDPVDQLAEVRDSARPAFEDEAGEDVDE